MTTLNKKLSEYFVEKSFLEEIFVNVFEIFMAITRRIE